MVFSAYRYNDFGSQDLIYGGDLSFNKIIVNQGYGLSEETGTFVAPIGGIYFMSFAAPKYKQGVIHIIVSKNGRQEFRIREYDSSNYQDNIQWSWMMDLQAFDQVTLNAPPNSIYCSDSIRITFSGFLIKTHEE